MQKLKPKHADMSDAQRMIPLQVSFIDLDDNICPKEKLKLSSQSSTSNHMEKPKKNRHIGRKQREN